MRTRVRVCEFSRMYGSVTAHATRAYVHYFVNVRMPAESGTATQQSDSKVSLRLINSCDKAGHISNP